jgi:16S rRNA processing protein RimM
MTNIYDESAKLVIANIGKPVGLKGHLKLHPQSDFTAQFKKGAKFNTGSIELTVESFDENRMLVKFAGYDTVESAKELSTKDIYSTVEESRQNCKLGKDEYFWFDIISC